MGEHADPRIDPWSIDESEFYEIESHQDQMAFLIRYAVLAPSGHNTQPWSFRITHDGVEVFADYSKRCIEADPADRELMLSIGTAVTNFCVAAAHFGYEATVLYQDRAEESLPVAFIALRETCATAESLRRLFPAITARRTNRGSFETREIEPDSLVHLNEFIAAHSSFVHFLVPQDRQRASQLVEKADRILLKSKPFRTELADWVRPPSTEACDGICADGLGIPETLGKATPWFLRRFDMGALQAIHDRSLIEHSAALIVITSEDDRVSLIRAGETLEMLLLLLTRIHLNYSFVNTPIEVETLRSQLWATLGSPHPPQLLLRVGYARSIPRPQPRRDADRTLIHT